MNKHWHSKIKENAALLIILVATYLIYAPGLYGVFLLDDHANLPQLKEIKGITDWRQILAYTINGISSSLGRPISLLSFAVQADAWNSNNPYAFKLVNLLIHLINGVLVFLLAQKIFKYKLINNTQHICAYSLLAAGIWLLHPLQVSTVHYIIQRMTELSAIFTLLGLLLYVHGRTNSNEENWKKSYFYMTTGIAVGLTLGILSKENAILICLYIAVMECTIFATIAKPRYWKGWATVFIAGPVISLIIYLTPGIIEHISSHYPIRNYGSFTRLLTETRIIVDYMGNIVLPRPWHFGLFHSDYSVSSSLFHPLTTLFSTIFLLALLTLAIVIRKSFPLISLGILWFFAGHSLESTVLNLELYFEHRNYLPIFGIGISVIGLYIALAEKLKKKEYKIGKMALTIGLTLWCTFIVIITFNEAKLWGNPILQAATWAKQHPHSFRAQGHYAELLTKIKAYEEAQKLLEKNTYSFKNDSTHIMNWLNLTCYSKTITPPRTALVKKQLTNSRYFNATQNIIDGILILKQTGKCDRIPNAQIENAILILKNNPNYQSPSVQSNLYKISAKLYMLDKRSKQAVAALSHAYNLSPSIDILLTVASIHLEEANKHWLIESIQLINQYCSKHKLKCLPYNDSIKEYNKILNNIKNQV